MTSAAARPHLSPVALPVAGHESLGGHLDHAFPLSEILAETGGEADLRGLERLESVAEEAGGAAPSARVR